jgi:hypothetical protein
MSNSESKTDSTGIPLPPTSNNSTPPVEDKTDDFGYSTENEKVVPPVEDKKDAPAKTDDKPVDKPVSGYGKDDNVTPPVEDKKDAPAQVDDKDLTDEQKHEKEITEAVNALGDSFDKEKIAKFAKDNKLSKAQVEAYANFAKEEEAEIIKSQEIKIQETRKAWKQELFKDPEFGGVNFDLNVDRVEKVLANYMPETKKMLTDKRSVLPPYVMKDLLKLSKALNPTTSFVGGDAPEAKKDDTDNYLDDLYS